MRLILDDIRTLEDFLAELGGTLQRLPMSECQLGQVRGDQILLRTGLSPEQELPTLIHELTHWLVHRDVFAGPAHTICEYEAEAVEAFVMARLGLAHLVTDTEGLTSADAADALLAQSKARVIFAGSRICAALAIANACADRR